MDEFDAKAFLDDLRSPGPRQADHRRDLPSRGRL